jgi:acetyl-CoA carboxylase biotin carboxyl carrier protein
VLTFEQIKELIELVAARGLEELQVERSGFRLRIGGRSAPAATSAPSAVALSAPPAVEAVAVTAESAPAPDLHPVTSPIVGTFYAAPSPDAEPFVRVGDRVRKGQVLCIVEAMKLMNEIEADADGEIVEIYPRNAQPVEFGEPLFGLRLT